MSAVGEDRRPALAASAVLHVAVLTAGLIAWPWLNKPMHLGEVVPVTLVTSQSAANIKPAIQAPTPAPAATEEPAPAPTPAPPAPEEAPTPAPPPTTRTPPQPKPKPEPAKPEPVQKVEPKPAPTAKPQAKAEAKPTPKPAPAPVKPAPAPAKTAPAKAAEPSFDPDAVLASLDRASKAAGSRHAAAARGPARPETAVEARLTPGAGAQISASALSNLGSELERLWNPNCDTQGELGVIKVSFRLDGGGRLIGDPQSSADNATNPVVKAASDRAKRAVYQGSPFDNLPQALYGQRITVNFNAQQFCANR
jgi:outer membrane biosynthesis protein TonB